MVAPNQQKPSVVIVYTGDGKGKTSAAIGLLARALGADKKVAFVQFIKAWEVSEHKFFAKISSIYNNCHSGPDPESSNNNSYPQNKSEDDDDKVECNSKFTFYKGGKGFFNAGAASAQDVTDVEHQNAARQTLDFAMNCATSGDYDLVICDEINNAVADELLTANDLEKLITERNEKTSLCLTGRNFPDELLKLTDIVTEMKKIKHHYDDGFLAQEGIDF